MADDDDASPGELIRLWRGFMTARVTLGLVLLVLQATVMTMGQTATTTLVWVSATYCIAALVARLFMTPDHLGAQFGIRWVLTIGIDIAVFSTLQVLQGGSINYAPLLVLPVLLSAVLGTLFLAMGTAAIVTLLLLLHSSWATLLLGIDATSHFAQSALMGAGCFVVAFLSHQISGRLAREEQRAQRNQIAAQTQRQVNELIIETLTEGVLVVDLHGQVRAANPAARKMLGADAFSTNPLPSLHSEPAWSALIDLTAKSFGQNDLRRSIITIRRQGQGLRHLQVRAQLTGRKIAAEENLCVIFLQDQRELEARMRTEKLASMGRMSAAVAHEIRNPLAAITQANALLEEEASDPRQLQLITMVAQNATRLDKIVDEVLNIGRVQTRDNPNPILFLDLNEAISRIGADWTQQTQSHSLILISLEAPTIQIEFDTDHLRRVMVNLLDNARRYADSQLGSIQARTRMGSNGQIVMDIWSAGPPIDRSVEQHLFEPFFSSESRSSGLGLYICRELCEGHGATISYQRSCMDIEGVPIEGNQFSVVFRRARSDRQPVRTRFGRFKASAFLS